ncbi:mannose-6-phosphate isomerase, class I [Bibersteinia trehalosi]|uniref:mannose-6-phosphate isomerase, class I n=1 Tax=Bibersteinia trehalosi TaxID=47735 RepID=UPI002D77A4CA|nr:mannose-6-phosphate isomerase, class I [Bibersteinia trehalosi]
MIFKLQGSYQHYAWGGSDFIPCWQQLAMQTPHKPYAEYWLGAHPSSPSLITAGQDSLALDQLLAAHPELLGTKSREQFGDELPFLLKILDVKQPLSIQLHPTKAQAEQGFERENQAGIALDAPNRTYKDRNHKPEMMIALSDFWLLHGFQPIEQIKVNLSCHPSLQLLKILLENQGLEALYKQIMLAEQAKLAEWLLPIIHARKSDFNAGKIALHEPDYWLLYAMQAMDIHEEKLDAGLLCFYLFNIVNVKKGEGIYQGAGLPHAYLRGQCIELMAASDNVIRGGLTPKYIDIPALLQTVDYCEIVPQLIAPAPQITGQCYLYPTPAAKDFALQHLAFGASEAYSQAIKNAAILLVMEGIIEASEQDNIYRLKQGEALFIGANSTLNLTVQQAGYAVLATLP